MSAAPSLAHAPAFPLDSTVAYRALPLLRLFRFCVNAGRAAHLGGVARERNPYGGATVESAGCRLLWFEGWDTAAAEEEEAQP